MKSENHRKVEAVLFAVGRDIAVEDVARFCNLAEEEAQTIIKDLSQDYNANHESALSLQQKGKFWKFTVKDTYLPLVTNLVQNTELDKSVMETLAVIAWRYPIIQSDLIKIRHNKAYDHLKMLEEREFVVKEKFGRTYKIKLTSKFFEYFDLPTQDAKEAFKKVIPPEIQEEIQRAEQDIEMKEQRIEEQEAKKAAEPKKIEKTEEQLAKEAADELDEDDEADDNEEE